MLPTLLLACAHHLPPPGPHGYGEREDVVIGELGRSVELLAERRFNLGRQQAVRLRAEELGLVTEREWIDWFSVQRNVLIEVPGTGPDLVYVSAHYDKVDINLLTAFSRMLNGLVDPLISWTWLTQGAVDNATGVAVALQLARDLAALPPRETGFRFLLAGAEEAGLRGSRAHVARLSPEEKARVTVAVNVDTVGVAGTGICVFDVSDASWEARLRERTDVELGTAHMPSGAASDHVAFQRNSALLDFRRGCMFGGPGGLLPQRSWFTTRSEMPVLVVSSCEMMDPWDYVASCCGVPTGRLHGPRDNLSKVDPLRLYEAYRALRSLLLSFD